MGKVATKVGWASQRIREMDGQCRPPTRLPFMFSRAFRVRPPGTTGN